MNNNTGRKRVRRARRQNKATISRILLTVGMMALIAVISIGGTIAWLTAQTDAITNTFTTSDIGLTLTETTGNTYKLIPGVDIAKDPEVTVTNDVDAYVFVKITEANWSTLLTYSPAEGWSELTGVTGVYYRTVDADATTKTFPVLADDQIVVSENITKDEMVTFNANVPTLSFMAYAIQTANGNDSIFTPADAWAQLNITNP